MTVRLAAAACKAACDAIADAVDVGTGSGTIKIKEGGTNRSIHGWPEPAFGAATTASPSVATANTITADTSVSATTVGVDNYLVEDANGDDLWTGDVSTSGADINFDTVIFCAGGTATITSLTVTVPRS